MAEVAHTGLVVAMFCGLLEGTEGSDRMSIRLEEKHTS